MAEEKQGYKNSLKLYNAVFESGARVKEIDTDRTKTGDGETKWSDLPYDDE